MCWCAAERSKPPGSLRASPFVFDSSCRTRCLRPLPLRLPFLTRPPPVGCRASGEGYCRGRPRACRQARESSATSWGVSTAVARDSAPVCGSHRRATAESRPPPDDQARIAWRVSSYQGPVQQLSARGEMMKTRARRSVRWYGGRTANGSAHSQLRPGAPTTIRLPGAADSAASLTSRTTVCETSAISRQSTTDR